VDDRPWRDTRAALAASLAALLSGLMLWLWPIGVGGRMPVGGDVTQFSIGLMAVLAQSIRAGRLPIWNDLWGYGFPGLAESQMGVYYPPHWLLYGLLPLEAAYTASLVAHTFWAGLGAFWATRKFGVSAAGSALAGFSWAGCGFFVIHIPHQWAYTAGSWMPWAWGLAWILASGRGTRRTPLLLALVLTLQVLPGHFQLAFYTEVGIVLLGLAAVAEPALRRQGSVRGVVGVGLALLAMAPLGAMQLIPTWRLARLAAAQRDYEYLSGFAATPVHLLSYVAPGLFHVSPLWRPIAWDPFRTSPEEHLAYIGLVPLFLALGVLIREVRREPVVRVLGVLALATLVLSLGPWVPGFRYLIKVPGFSFFRAPARWEMATQLALCILAGRGFDTLGSWRRPGTALAGFVVSVAVVLGLFLATLELALTSSDRTGWPAVRTTFAVLAGWIPGPNPEWPDPAAPDFGRWMNEARKPHADPRVRAALARQGGPPMPASGWRFYEERHTVYRQELGAPAALLVILLVASALDHRRRFLAMVLAAVTVIDIWGVSRNRYYDLGPVRPLTAQSPVLALLAREPRGTRTFDPAKNLPMVAGAAPLSAYRTLDLPTMVNLNRYASLAPLSRSPDLAEFRATGAALSILDPEWTAIADRMAVQNRPGWSARQRVQDPALAGWLYGADLVAQEGTRAATFTVWRHGLQVARAWLVPLTPDRMPTILDTARGEPEPLARVLESASPLELRSHVPERLELNVDIRGSATVIVSQLFDPQWQGRWVASDGQQQPAAVRRVFKNPGGNGWQMIDVPGPGRWTLRLEYVARDAQAGLTISGVSFLVLLGLAILLRPGRPPVKAVPS
jgi:hypothetical protein